MLILGDCMSFMESMEKDSVTMTLTDIPYGEVNRKDSGLRKFDKGKADIATFDVENFVRDVAFVTAGSIYIFCGTEQVSLIRKTMVECGLSTRLCIWEKSNPSPCNGQYMWLSGIECCVYGRKPKATFNERCKNTVWTYPVGRSKQHPTQKPLKLFEYLISVSSNAGDVVFDPCCGSGTTLVGAKRLGRKWIGVELDESYYEIAKQRLDEQASSLI